jgi:hypothetical protein
MMEKKPTREISNRLIKDKLFKNRHISDKNYFTRQRKLSFPLMIRLIMRKSVKSLQLILNELRHQLNLPSISHSAFSQRRAQLK